MEKQTCPKCGFPRQPQALDCPACGIVYAKYQGPALAAAANPYAPPQSDPISPPRPAALPPPLPTPPVALEPLVPPAADPVSDPAPAPEPAPEPEPSVCRLGSLLVLRWDTKLPDRCVCCNRPAIIRWIRTFAWVDGGPPRPSRTDPSALLSYFSPGRRTVEIEVPLCGMHNQKRKDDLRQPHMVALAGAAMVVVSQVPLVPYVLSVLLAVLGVSVLAAGLYFSHIEGNPLEARKIGDCYVWLHGAAPEYLDSLPLSPPIAGSPDPL